MPGRKGERGLDRVECRTETDDPVTVTLFSENCELNETEEIRNEVHGQRVGKDALGPQRTDKTVRLTR